MVKKLKKIGNGNALFLDRAIMELIGLPENGEVKLVVHNGSVIITPVRPNPVDQKRFEACLDRVVAERREVLRRLAE